MIFIAQESSVRFLIPHTQETVRLAFAFFLPGIGRFVLVGTPENPPNPAAENLIPLPDFEPAETREMMGIRSFSAAQLEIQVILLDMARHAEAIAAILERAGAYVIEDITIEGLIQAIQNMAD